MAITIGILCAFIAMFCWGIGDFLIQRSTRRSGNWETLFVITLFGSVVLLPFVATKTVHFITAADSITILLLASAVLIIATLLEFESLKRGKLAVIEPIWSTEILSSVVLAFFLLGEHLDIIQIVLIVCLIAGLILVSLRRIAFVRHIFLERAALLALVAALIMGGANFLFGVAARETDPLVVNFFTSTVLAIISFVYLLFQGKLRGLVHDVVTSPREIVAMTIFDNGAWIAFAFAMTLAPIGVAVALSESYIIVAVLLGLYKNKERLRLHQKVGLVIAICAAVILASVTL